MTHAIAEQIAPLNISRRDREKVPGWDAFTAGEKALGHIEQLVDGTGNQRGDITALMRVLRTDLAAEQRPIAYIDRALPELQHHLSELQGLSATAVPVGTAGSANMGALVAQTRLAVQLRAVAEANELNLIDRLDPEANRLQKRLQALAKLDEALAAAEAPNRGWTRKPSPAETEQALAVARAKQDRFWSFLSGEWRAVKRMVAGQHRGAGKHVEVLERLAAEHAARAARDEDRQRVCQTFGLEELAEVQAALEDIWSGSIGTSPEEKALIDACIRKPGEQARSVIWLATEQGRLARARAAIDRLFQGYDGASVDELAARAATLDVVKEKAVDLARRMAALHAASPELSDAWRDLPYTLGTLKAACLHTTIDRALDARPDVQAMTAAGVQALAIELGTKLKELRDLNARVAIEERRQRFRTNSTAGRKSYDDGRAFLEHQFALQRPSAAMRDVLSGSAAQVVRDLKPIWMMSPLSVADTLPLHEGLFDVVVFDEASQIPIEDAVPTLYRAPQAIVVGDEMQLPPPSYFSKKLDTDTEDLPDYIAFGMQAESLLDKAVVALGSTRLDWHYRSRHEGLIAFCNQAFYAGALKTIPSRQMLEKLSPIDTQATGPRKTIAARVLSRPISFHKIDGAHFSSQQNLQEAAYIAELVRALLSTDGGKSIGIVAFSQPQQTAIEEALDRLAAGNQAFRTKLDQAFGDDDEELFVKNLENVQGDERDIIIVSVAYAPNEQGRMIMNFGPINQEGGEKRLNVIFSRAKHHMAVVTSITPSMITNDHNKGANALKRYLMYAAAASSGDRDAMRIALSGFPGSEHVERVAQVHDPLADAIAAQNAVAGLVAERSFGQSTVRCDVAVRDPKTTVFTKAILTDNDAHYEVADVVDRYVTYPDLLRAAGWEVEFALAKDWLGSTARAVGTNSSSIPPVQGALK